MINLVASRRISEILTTIPIPVAVAEYVYSVELISMAPDLDNVILGGAIQIVPLAPGAEEVTAVNFSFHLDNGEAFTGAIAVHHIWAIGIDDAKAIRCFQQQAPHLQLITTPELISHWANVMNAPLELVREVVRNVRENGRYKAPRKHALYDWWQRFM